MKNWRTDELNMAGFLQEKGFRLVTAERVDGHTTFVFDDPEEKAQLAALSFYNGAEVVAVLYTDRLRHLKTLVKRGLGV